MMDEMDDDRLFEVLDDLVQRALAGEDLTQELSALSAAARSEFAAMLGARGGTNAGQGKPLTEPPTPQSAAPADSTTIAAFLDAYWADRAAGRTLDLSAYLARYPGDPGGVARCFLALEDESREASGFDATAGQVGIGSYRFEEVLGRGGQATVYRAEDAKLGRKVALKVFDRAASLNEKGLERFKREARAVSRIAHANVGQVYEAGVANGQPFIAMELVSGESLAQHLRQKSDETPSSRSSREEIEAKLVLLEKIALGLDAAHNCGVIHRDLKPANIMLRTDGSPVLLDFGLAKIEDESPGITATQDLLGTPAYIAPERLAHPGLAASRLEDIYALGITAYELFAGRRPFDAPTIDEIFRLIRSGNAPAVDTINPAVSRDVAVIVATAMERDPHRRFRDAAQLAADLARARRGESVSVRPIGPLVRSLRWYRRNAVVATATLLILATFATASWNILQQNRSINDLRDQAILRGDRLAQSLDEVETLRGEAVQRGDELEGLRQSAVQRGDELAQTLEEVLLLSDVKKVDDLVAESNTLWPIAPETESRMRSWLERARELVQRREQHEAALKTLLDRRLPLDRKEIESAMPEVWQDLEAMRDQLATYDDGRAGLTGDQAVAAKKVVEELLAPRLNEYSDLVLRLEEANFPEAADAWRADVLKHLVAQLKAFADRDLGIIEVVANRLKAATTLVEQTVTSQSAQWLQVQEELQADPRFADFQLDPQPGLIPLGPDPASGLQEFLHLLSHGDIPIPQRDANGKLPKLVPECGLILVLIPGGRFRMGSPSDEADPGFDPYADSIEQPAHEVELDPYLIAKYEVCQMAWGRLTGENPSAYKDGLAPIPTELITALNPVEFVNWYDAVETLRRFNLQLPTEAQWERAARAGTLSPWNVGQDLESCRGVMNIIDKTLNQAAARPRESGIPNNDDGHALHAPVDKYAPNAFGLYQVHGNVFEWCLDRFSKYDVPHRPGDGLLLGRQNVGDVRVFRGGSYLYQVFDARSAKRLSAEADARDPAIGIRPACQIVHREAGR